MSWLPPLLVAIPLISGAAIAAGDHVAPEVSEKVVAVAGAAATAALALVLLVSNGEGTTLHWFGGWRPRHGVALGVDFAVGPIEAGMCAVIAVVVLLVLVYSWTYMKGSARLFEALTMVALGAMCGFAMAGDIFDMFVWLELAGVAGYALTGFKVEQLGPIEGAVNFAIVTSIGGYLFVIGISLLYARTGTLNLARMGESLGRGSPTGITVVALTLVTVAMLTKAAAVPFHLWAADAYAVAPAPVCAMFGAVMTDIGLIGVARVWWTVFAAPFAHEAAAVGDLLLWVGIVTALLAAVMALLQRHLKRMLAYSVVSHIGGMLAGIGLLDGKGLAGTAVTFVSHAFLTAALFLVCGSLLAERGTIDELRLRERRASSPVLATIWVAATVGLVGAPFLGTYLGHALIDEGAAAQGRHWVQPLLWLASALAAAALLRAAGRAFLGLGEGADPLLGRELEEEPVERDVHRGVMRAVAGVALCLGLVVSVVPGLEPRAEVAAEHFRDRGAYVATVLHGAPAPPVGRLPVALPAAGAESLAYAAGATLLSFALAALALRRRPLPARRLLEPPAHALKALHTGVVGDYVVWLLVGTAIFGGVWTLTLAH